MAIDPRPCPTCMATYMCPHKAAQHLADERLTQAAIRRKSHALVCAALAAKKDQST